MKNILILTIVFVFFSCKTVKSKTKTISKITFFKEALVTDKSLYEETSYDFAREITNDLINEVVKERKALGKSTNEAQISVLKVTLVDQMKKQFFDTRFKTFKEEIFYNSKDSLSMAYKQENDFKIAEFKNDTKIVENFKCFKVVVSFKENSEKDMPKMLSDIIIKYEMYVTDKIKNAYHPVIKYKSILDRYYPLEVIETLESIKGAQIDYKLVRLEKE